MKSWPLTEDFFLLAFSGVLDLLLSWSEVDDDLNQDLKIEEMPADLEGDLVSGLRFLRLSKPLVRRFICVHIIQ